MEDDVFWADVLADQIIKERGKKKAYIVASGITPSGTVHIGRGRELITSDMVRRALDMKGVKVKHLHFWDNFDRFRKVPGNVPQSHEKFLGMHVSEVPDPFECHTSYAEHFEREFSDVAPLIGITPEYMSEYDIYKSCEYKDEIKHALNHKEEIKAALNKFRKEELGRDWYPVEIYCEKCRRDDGSVTNYDSNYTIKYKCTCGHLGSVDFSKTGDVVKLRWRTNWAMRWKHYDIDFEPAGKEHSSPGGSRDTSKLICENVYNHSAPVYQMYDFVIGKGVGGKLSGSKGAPAIADLLKIYLPEVFRFLYAGTRPRSEFSIPIAEDEIFKVYEDFYFAERVYYDKEEANEKKTINLKRVYEMSCPIKPEKKMQPQIPFKYLAIISQFYKDNSKIIEKLIETKHITSKDKNNKRIESLIKLARFWAENYAPETYKYILNETNIRELNEKEKEALGKLISEINTVDEQRLYDIGKETGLRGEFFKLCYNILLKKDRGPRLVELLDIVGREKVKAIFERYL